MAWLHFSVSGVNSSDGSTLSPRRPPCSSHGTPAAVARMMFSDEASVFLSLLPLGSGHCWTEQRQGWSAMRRMKYQGNDKASGSRTHDKDELQVLCYNCRKPGHFKAECPYPIVKKHQDEHNYKKNSGRYHHPKSNPNDADEDSSSESDSSEDEKGLLCLFSQEDSDEEMCLMAEEEEVTSQNQSFNYSSESVCHENPREAFEKMMKSFYGIEDSHLKLKEENAKLLAERQDLEDLKSKNAEMLESISQLEKQPFHSFPLVFSFQWEYDIDISSKNEAPVVAMTGLKKLMALSTLPVD
nr:lisH domain-containing protein C1711.05-like [Ipomoea batatas]